MEITNPRCAGVDVHQKTVVVSRRVLEESTGELREDIRTFGTVTAELNQLGDWLEEAGVTVVAMESTGVYWKPVWNVLESRFTLLLINAQHIKQVSGRKTDVKDCQWIAQLLQHGLLRGSFVPPTRIREMRDLTRHRSKLVGEKTAVCNRIQKTLEDANIKLSAVASDVLGVSGRAMLRALVAGESDPARLAGMAQGRLRAKTPELLRAMEGRFTGHHSFLLETLLGHLEFLEAQIGRLDQRIEEVSRPFQPLVHLLVTCPGVQQRTAENLLAEIGTDMNQFPSSDHLASWTGICPGNDESAGKRRSGKTPKGNRWLRRTLGEAAWAAARTKDTYLSARYRRLASRRGKKRAIVGIGHSILVSVYHMLKGGVPYKELGPQHFDQIDPQRLTRYLVRRLEKLGHEVVLQPAAAAA